jgi:hypothetical protein
MNDLPETKCVCEVPFSLLNFKCSNKNISIYRNNWLQYEELQLVILQFTREKKPISGLSSLWTFRLATFRIRSKTYFKELLHTNILLSVNKSNDNIKRCVINL